MYRMIAGYRVFGPRDAAAAAESGMEPQRPQGLSDSQWKALKKALAYSRVARYSSPKEFIDDLKVGKTEPVVPLTADERMVDTVEPQGRSRWPVALGAALVIGALAYVGLETRLLD